MNGSNLSVSIVALAFLLTCLIFVAGCTAQLRDRGMVQMMREREMVKQGMVLCQVRGAGSVWTTKEKCQP